FHPPTHPFPHFSPLPLSPLSQTMNSDLESLRITKAQLEKLTGLDIGSVFMGGVVRPSTFRSVRRVLSLIVTEGSVLGVVFIICLGLGLVIARSLSSFNNVTVLLLIGLGITVVSAIAWNAYQCGAIGPCDRSPTCWMKSIAITTLCKPCR
ncbi:MAG: hypothetical protein AAFW75_24275, partial [Cyanobacteria bacterium J06636_16]